MRRNHSSLRHNGLAGRWLWRRSRSRLHIRCRSRSFRLRLWRHNCRRWRLRRRRNHDRWRRCRFFRGRRRRNHRRRRSRFGRWRRDYSSLFCCRRCGLGNNNRRLNYRWRCRCSRCLRFSSRRRYCRLANRWRRCCSRPHRRCRRLVLLLLSFPEQPRYVAGLGDLGEIDLRLDVRRRRPLSYSRAGFGRKVLAHPFRFILLKRT